MTAPTPHADRITAHALRVAVSLTTVAIFTFAAASTISTPPAAGGEVATRAAGTLELRGKLRMSSVDEGCPPGASDSTRCHARTARGFVPGLGDVSQTYMYNGDPDPCPNEEVKILGYTTSFIVAGKGEIQFAVADAPQCLAAFSAGLTATQSFRVTSGTGIYAGVSGSGRIERVASFTGGGAAGFDTWIGALVVPGFEFDVTPPTVAGATSKTVRAPKGAKRVRVTYAVTARDDVDGVVPVSCSPRSGSRFSIGRTVVYCIAADTSGNTGTATFLITVKKGR